MCKNILYEERNFSWFKYAFFLSILTLLVLVNTETSLYSLNKYEMIREECGPKTWQKKRSPSQWLFNPHIHVS